MKASYRGAVHDAIAEAMRADERVVLLGEDVGRYGGTYAVSKGLLEEFGPERIRDTRSRSWGSSASASAPPSTGCGPSSR